MYTGMLIDTSLKQTTLIIEPHTLAWIQGLDSYKVSGNTRPPGRAKTFNLSQD